MGRGRDGERDGQSDRLSARFRGGSQILLDMLQENGLQGFEFYRNDYSVPNVRARSLSGSYLLGVEAFEFRALMAQYGHTVWYFMVAYPRSKPEGLLVAERFFQGILIDRRLTGATL